MPTIAGVIVLLLVGTSVGGATRKGSNGASVSLNTWRDARTRGYATKQGLELAFLHCAEDGACGRFLRGRRARRWSPRGRRLSMVRNVDLPECIVFYGLDTVLSDPSKRPPTLQAGVLRLLKECQEVDVTRTILLLEEHDLAVVAADDALTVLGRTPLQPYIQDRLLTVRSCADTLAPPPQTSADGVPIEDPDSLYEMGEMYNLGLAGQSPCPAFLLDALRSITVVPAKYASGGSSGITGGAYAFNVDPLRPPLPVHTVVIVGRTPATRDRCTAARLAGTRVLHVEGHEGGDSDVEGFADAIVDTLGSDDDWEIVTLDDVSTPGSFWINPPFPRNDDGIRVDEYSVIRKMQKRKQPKDTEKPTGKGPDAIQADDELSDSEMARILSDLDPL